MKRRRFVPTAQAGINLTSLMDIVFVLLIAFMIVAPSLKNGVDLELPKVREAPSLSKQDPISIAVALSKSLPGEAEVFVNGRLVPAEEVAEEVLRLRSSNPSLAVTLEADRKAPWETVAQVITDLRNNGIENVGIVTLREGSA